MIASILEAIVARAIWEYEVNALVQWWQEVQLAEILRLPPERWGRA